MSITRTEVFRRALKDTMSIPPECVHQVSYYAYDLDALVEEMSGMAAAGWRKFRRTERIKVYPGYEVPQEAVFYVANHHEYMPGVETELIQPLTFPNYIGILDIASRQVAHLSVKALVFDGDDDQEIIRRMTQSNGQLIQKGHVRVGRNEVDHYAIYNVNDFLPVKIIR